MRTGSFDGTAFDNPGSLDISSGGGNVLNGRCFMVRHLP